MRVDHLLDVSSDERAYLPAHFERVQSCVRVNEFITPYVRHWIENARQPIHDLRPYDMVLHTNSMITRVRDCLFRVDTAICYHMKNSVIITPE